MKIKDANGKEIEVFTQEEVDAKVKTATESATNAASKLADEKAQQAIENYKASNPDRTTEIETLKDKLSEAEAKLAQAEGYDDKSGNRDEQIKRLREDRDKAIGELNKKIDDLTKQITESKQADVTALKNELLDKYSKDPEVRSKIEIEFNNYKPNEITPAALAERMEKAATLAGVNKEEKPGMMDNLGGGRRGDANYGGGSTGPTQNAVNIGKALGVSEQELKDHQAAKGEANK